MHIGNVEKSSSNKKAVLSLDQCNVDINFKTYGSLHEHRAVFTAIASHYVLIYKFGRAGFVVQTQENLPPLMVVERWTHTQGVGPYPG